MMSVSALAVGCRPDDDPVDPEEAVCIDLPAPATSPTLIAGAYEQDAFIEVKSGSTLILQHGIQGGTHLDLAARVFNLAPSPVVLELSVEGSASGTTTIAADSCEGWIEMVGRVFEPPEGDAELRVRLLDDGGAELAAQAFDIFVL